MVQTKMSSDQSKLNEQAELSALAKVKNQDELEKLANSTASTDYAGLEPILKAIELGLIGSNRQAFVVSKDDYNHAIFIADSFDEIKSKIQALPDI